MDYSKEIAQLNEQIIELMERVNSLQVLYEQVNSQSQHWQNMFLTGTGIVVAIVGVIVSIGVFQTLKSMINSKMDEEIKRRGDKANIRKPEFINSIGISTENAPSDLVRVVKLDCEPTINIETDKQINRMRNY